MKRAEKIINKIGITEMSPRLTNFDLPLSNLSEIRTISVFALDNRFEKIAEAGNILIYRNKVTNGFVTGSINLNDKSELLVYLVIDGNDSRLVMPSKLKSLFQIGYVQVKDIHASNGLAKLVYKELIKKFDIVSDTDQFLGGYWIWKSLIKESIKSNKFNIYIFDGNKGDYFRDNSGKIIRYNGSNIPKENIWSKDDYQEKIVLVATKLNLN